MRAGAKFIIKNNFKSTQLSQNKAKNKNKKQQINIHSIIETQTEHIGYSLSSENGWSLPQ